MNVLTDERRGADLGQILPDCAYPILQSYVWPTMRSRHSVADATRSSHALSDPVINPA